MIFPYYLLGVKPIKGEYFINWKVMAIANDNILTRYQRGRIGNIIFRRWGENTVASVVPDYSKIKWSAAQKDNRNRFRDAMVYARKALRDPKVYEYYKKKRKGMQTVWNVAVADYMKRPQITNIDVSRYRGLRGNVIRIKAKDNYFVASVVVRIVDAQGVEVESGMAVSMSGRGEWIYKAMEQNSGWKGGRVVVNVTDVPRNMVRAEVSL
jgi:hypothetical protein